MKNLLLTTLLLLTLTSTAFANNAPPQLNLNINIPQEDTQQESPPELNLNVNIPEQETAQPPENNQEPQAEPINNTRRAQNQDIEILSHSITPTTLNPLTGSGTVYYKLQGTANIDVKIYNSNNQLVQTLVANKLHGAGEYLLKWYGTANGQQGGTPLDIGSYSYRITAKNPLTGNTEDTGTGSMRLLYANSTPPSINLATNNNPNPDPQAFIANQNRTTGTTSNTGPAALIYLLSPLAAYTYRKKYAK